MNHTPSLFPTSAPHPPTSSPRRWGTKQVSSVRPFASNQCPFRHSAALSLKLAFTTAIILSLAPASTLAEPTTQILPIWREVFARPDTSQTAIPAPPDNKLTPAKVHLGKRLFFDKRLSADITRSCATCHDPAHAFTDGRKRAAARDQTDTLPNTPHLYNLAWAKRLFWDGRANSLEQQARFPIEHPQEMAGYWPQIIDRLEANREVMHNFRQAFPQSPSPSIETVIAALASYQRTLISPTSRFDRFISGHTDALGQKELAGFKIFVGKGGCVGCHSGWRFTDDRLHNVPQAGDPSAPNRKIKTPGLRGLTKTAPYMRNGALISLDDVINHYQNINRKNIAQSANLVRPLTLNARETEALLSFLRAIDSKH